MMLCEFPKINVPLASYRVSRNETKTTVHILYWVYHFVIFHLVLTVSQVVRFRLMCVNTVEYYVFLLMPIYKMYKKTANKYCFHKVVAVCVLMWHYIQLLCMELNICKALGWWEKTSHFTRSHLFAMNLFTRSGSTALAQWPPFLKWEPMIIAFASM